MRKAFADEIADELVERILLQEKLDKLVVVEKAKSAHLLRCGKRLEKAEAERDDARREVEELKRDNMALKGILYGKPKTLETHLMNVTFGMPKRERGGA